MSEKRLALELGEILHLEIYCDACQNSSILPLEDRPGEPPYFASHSCVSCTKEFREVPGFQNALSSVRQGLTALRLMKDTFAVRLIIQQ
jgi:hypothetical protein